MNDINKTSPAGETADEGVQPASPSLAEDMRGLLADGQQALQNELEFQKARFAISGKAGLHLAILGVIAVLLLHGAILALTVGLVFALASLINPWAATAIVTGLYLALVGLCGLLALRKWKQIRAAFAKAED